MKTLQKNQQKVIQKFAIEYVAKALEDLRPWAKVTSVEVLSGKVISASPVRSGKDVQVRFRLGKRMATLAGQPTELRVFAAVTKYLEKQCQLETDLFKNLTTFCTQQLGFVDAITLKDIVDTFQGEVLKLFESPVTQAARELTKEAKIAYLSVPSQDLINQAEKYARKRGITILQRYMDHAIKEGVTVEDVAEILKKALVRSVLES